MIDGLRILEHIATSQNVVLKASADGQPVVLRLTSPMHRSADAVQAEVDLLHDLQSVTTCAIAPMRFRSGRLVETVRYEEQAYAAVLFPFIDGAHAPVASFETASRFGTLLAELHTAFDALGPRDGLPLPADASERHRIIHGDFNPMNVLHDGDAFVVIDFEASRSSTAAFELANTIYMQLFDARHAVEALIATDFVPGFLTSYTRRFPVPGAHIRAGIDTRVAALESWLRHRAEAPLVISNSSREWRDELHDFVRAYAAGDFRAFLDTVAAADPDRAPGS